MDEETTRPNTADSSVGQTSPTPKPAAAIGLDIGFGGTKAYRASGKSLTFPSAAAEAPKGSGGRNEGVTVMHAELYQHLNKAHPDYQLDRTEVPEIMLKGGLYMYGDWIDLHKPIERIKKSFMDRVNNLLREVWPEGTARLRRIVFTGGGAAALQPYIEAGGGKTFAAKRAMIPSDLVHANAIGFEKIAATKATRRG